MSVYGIGKPYISFTLADDGNTYDIPVKECRTFNAAFTDEPMNDNHMITYASVIDGGDGRNSYMKVTFAGLSVEFQEALKRFRAGGGTINALMRDEARNGANYDCYIDNPVVTGTMQVQGAEPYDLEFEGNLKASPAV